MIRLAFAGMLLAIVGCTNLRTGSDADLNPQYLFVQVSRSGDIQGDLLTLREVNAQTIFFSDRPKRIAGHLATSEFVRLWKRGSNSFQHDPPNASLAIVTRGIQSVVVIELRDPILEGTDLKFRVRILRGSPPTSFSDASLFIDSAGALTNLIAIGAEDVY